MDYVSITTTLLASIMLVSSSVFVMVKDWRDQVHRYYLYYASSGLGIIFTMCLTYSFPHSEYLTQINRITQMATLFFFSGVLLMAIVFPKREKKYPFNRSLLIVSPAVIVGIIVASTDLTITRVYFEDGVLKRDYTKALWMVDFYTVYASLAFTYLLIGTIYIIVKYFRIQVYVYRLQMRYVFVGASIGFVTAAVCSIILPKFFNYSRLYAIGPALAAFFAAFSFFYSVIAYNLNDIKTVIHKTTTYMIISMIIFLPIIAIIHIYFNNIFNFAILPSFAVAAIIVIIFFMFTLYIQPLIDKLFKRKQYEFERILNDFIRKIEDVRDLQSIIRNTVDTLYDSLYLRNAFFVMYGDESRKYELEYYRGKENDFKLEPIERSTPLIRWFLHNQDILTLSRVYVDNRAFADLREDIVSFYSAAHVQVIIPIYHERLLIGMLCLGEKDSLSGYDPKELEKLSYFRIRSNDFISTAITYKKSMKEQIVARTINLSSAILAQALPDSLPNMNTIKFGAFTVPKYSQGSDYFDFLRPGSQGIGVFAADVAGVGINSALVSVVLRSALHAQITEAPSSHSVMQNINKVLYNYSGGRGGLITAFYFYFDIKSIRVSYTNAGYPGMELFRVEKNNFDVLDTEGIPLGYDDITSYGTGRTNLLRGDIGILYSKTLINSKNQKAETFGISRMRRIIIDNRTRHPSDIAVALKNSYNDFMGTALPDSDINVIIFKIV